MAATAIDTDLKHALRDFRTKMKAGRKAEIEADTVRSLASTILERIESADKKEELSLTEQYVSLLETVIGSKRLRQGMTATLEPMTVRLSGMEGNDDARIRDNHRHLIRILKLTAESDLAKYIPLPALIEARGNLRWYADFAPTSWGKLVTAFADAVQPHGPWKTALDHADRIEKPEGIRHQKIAVATQSVPLEAGSPHVYFKGRMESPMDVATRLGKCLADPNRLPEAVQVTAMVASHPVLRTALDPHNSKLARRLIRAVRRDAKNSELLARFTESVGDGALASIPRRKLKAVMAVMPPDHAARCGRNIAAEKAPATVKHALIKAAAQTAATQALKTLKASKPSQGYRKVIDQIDCLADPKARRLAIEPVLRPLVASIFRDARRDEKALMYFDRLIPMAGGALREAGLLGGQIEQYRNFAGKSGLTKSLKTLEYHLSVKKPAAEPARTIPPLALMVRPSVVGTAAQVIA